MALFAFRDLTLEILHDCENTLSNLAEVLEELSWVKVPCSVAPSLRLSVELRSNGLRAPPWARELFRADGFSGLVSGDDFYLTDGSSLLHLQPGQGRGTASIASSFFAKRPLLQSNFWAFSLLKLLRPLGLYSVHAAAVVAKGGLGLLIIGPSGSGKSTLAIGLIRHGWSYLSDDAVLLRSQAEKVEALALRKHFYIDADQAPSSAELPLGEEVPDTSGRQRRRVHLEGAYTGQHLGQCLPEVLLFSRIVPQAQSSLLPIDRIDVLRRLLAGSGPQLFDKATMTRHLEVLKRLVQQTVGYELRAGLDLYRDPMLLMRLLNEAEGARRWPAL
jgi:HPr Serine kinase C-terminal domain